MKLEKEVYIDKVKGIHNKDNDRIFTTLDIVFCDLLTEEEISKLSKLTNKVKLTLKTEEPILDEVERKYLSGVIRPFRDKIRFITKRIYDLDGKSREYIAIVCYGWTINFPAFKIGTMYEGMELNKEYTLEELGL